MQKNFIKVIRILFSKELRIMYFSFRFELYVFGRGKCSFKQKNKTHYLYFLNNSFRNTYCMVANETA